MRSLLLLVTVLAFPALAHSQDDFPRPHTSELITEWGAKVTPENAWTEYPRPQMRRDAWQNLNGEWDYTVTPIEETETPPEWAGKILVPYCLESKLGGVQRLLQADEALWYHRTFAADAADGLRTLLHFEAVDYACRVYLNGELVGSHRGGNNPFSFDVTDAVTPGENRLVVRVEDATEAWQLHGKQKLDPHGIWYTRVSGIWQTVWLERVPSTYLADLTISTDAAEGAIGVAAEVAGEDAATRLRVVVKEGGETVAEVDGEGAVTAFVTDAKLWSPISPTLYDLEVTLLNEQGAVLDSVSAYAGIRSLGKRRDENGRLRFTLNGERIFHWGPLDQGWWPDGLLTPPSDEGMLYDIEFLKAAGFNMIRKHIKVEPRRYYYHCDRLGMLVWQDQVSGGDRKTWPKWTFLEPDPVESEWPEEQHEQFLLEFEELIDSLENHPSIVVWGPFNEAWGQHRTMRVGQWNAQRDPSRLVNIASGGNFFPVGDIVDAHKYPNPGFPFKFGAGGRFDDYIKVMGEFGGHGFPVKGHLWKPDSRNWGYGGLPKNKQEWKERYKKSLGLLAELRSRGISAGVYTQTSDVEGEINGLLTYDRKVAKVAAEELAEWHRTILFGDGPGDSSSAAARPSAPRAMSPDEIRAGLQSHDRALYIKTGWIRDPYIVLGPDGMYYLTGTQAAPDDPNETMDLYNTGLGPSSIVGGKVRIWRSRDLVDWEYVGHPFDRSQTWQAQQGERRGSGVLWAPEIHWLGDRWALVHCPKQVSSLALSAGADLAGPWTHPMGPALGQRHDPSIFIDDDGKRYLLWENTRIAPLKDDFSGYAGKPTRIDPAGSRPGPNGRPIRRIGHEGATMIKVGDKYVHFGTAWSTDRMRKGSYNLYYCVADKITGPYGPRKFAGRFLGHGTPFQDKSGKWWCTAFYNADVPPLSREGIRGRDLSENAQTINQQGVTIVPLQISVDAQGEILIRAKDPDYATPGPDEAQKDLLTKR